MQIVKAIQRNAEHYSSINPWNNVYGLARSLLALGTMLTLLFNDVDLLFHPSGHEAKLNGLFKFSQWDIFHLLSPHLNLAKCISIAILLLVVSGWRPRITGLLHCWISFSFMASCVIIDGGDMITNILSILLLPVCLADKRRWHWENLVLENPTAYQKILNLIAVSALLVIRLQVAIIYFHAGIAKLNVNEYLDGTAMYYWAEDPTLGLSSWLKPVLMPLFANSITVLLITWGAVLIEITLFMGIVIDKKYRSFLLKLGLLFHFAILLIFGLFTFFIAMAAALILYLGPIEKGLIIPLWIKRLPLFNRLNFS